ncbi:MAG: HupE/UreJ family protein [Proteobacteria bacterium]|nr:HupE/UreJ family protein [Burkholderiales bacterium]
MKRVLRWMMLGALALFATAGSAHELTMAELEMREIAPGQFVWQWTASGTRPAADELTVVWPAGCTADANVVRCGEAGLRGTLGVDGVGKRYSAAMLKVAWLDGQSRVYTLTKGQPQIRVYGSADDNRGMGEIASAYLVLGIEHILSGLDHLMFVIALLFLVGFNRRLIWTITAFTAAHSITLALGALGVLTLRPPPVEATIALSIMLVAAEALSKQTTMSRRWPALVAFVFGLIHGLGFAGALEEIGLPQNHLAVALLTFNVGVELGQLLVVGVAYLIYRFFARVPTFALARTPALYVIGSAAAYWSIGRIVNILA